MRTGLKACTLLMALMATGAVGDPPYLEIESIDRETAHLIVLEVSRESTVSLEAVDVDPTLLANSRLTDHLYPVDTDIVELLLWRGIARLKDRTAAPPQHLQAEDRAKALGMGVWKSTETVIPRADRPKAPEPSWWSNRKGEVERWWSRNRKAVIEVVSWIFGAGIAALLLSGAVRMIRWLHKMYRQKKVQLILIGEPSAGKTAVHWRIRDPNVDKANIRELKISKAKTRWTSTIPITRGRFEIFSTVVDVAGTRPGDHWDEFLVGGLSKLKAFVLVLAPHRLDRSSEAFDEIYIAEQLGYTRAMVQGALTATKTRKPRCVVVFVNKFDLISKRAPGNLEAEEAEQQVLSAFGEHIGIVKDAAKRAGVPCEVLVGSALEGWRCDRIVDVVTRTLYGA